MDTIVILDTNKKINKFAKKTVNHNCTSDELRNS